MPTSINKILEKLRATRKCHFCYNLRMLIISIFLPDGDECSSDKLGFNGIAECKMIDVETYECILSCPQGMTIEFPAAESYVCRFADGYFEPKSVPRCLPTTTKTISETREPEDSTCFTWGGVNYKTFDGKIYSFGKC